MGGGGPSRDVRWDLHGVLSQQLQQGLELWGGGEGDWEVNSEKLQEQSHVSSSSQGVSFLFSRLGDIEHMRSVLPDDGQVLEPHQLYWMTDM